MLALIVIGERLDNTTITYAAVLALVDHALKFAAQQIELHDSVVHRPEMMARYAIRLLARSVRLLGHGQKPAYVFDLKAQLPRVPDEADAVDLVNAVLPPIAGRAGRGGDQTDVLVEPVSVVRTFRADWGLD